MSLEPEPRQRIVEAAVRLRRQGRALSMGSLASAAGLSRASLYRHLGGRRELDALLAKLGVAPAPSPRDKVLTAALAAVARHGPGGFTLEELALEAGVSPTTVYREFGDRTGLLRAVIERVGPPIALVRLLEDLESPVEEVLVRFVTTMVERLALQPLLLGLLGERTSEHLRALRRERRAGESVSAALRRYFSIQRERGRIGDVSAELLTTALIGQVTGILFSRIWAEPPRTGVDVRARELVALFLRGAAPSESR